MTSCEVFLNANAVQPGSVLSEVLTKNDGICWKDCKVWMKFLKLSVCCMLLTGSQAIHRGSAIHRLNNQCLPQREERLVWAMRLLYLGIRILHLGLAFCLFRIVVGVTEQWRYRFSILYINQYWGSFPTEASKSYRKSFGNTRQQENWQLKSVYILIMIINRQGLSVNSKGVSRANIRGACISFLLQDHRFIPSFHFDAQRTPSDAWLNTFWTHKIQLFCGLNRMCQVRSRFWYQDLFCFWNLVCWTRSRVELRSLLLWERQGRRKRFVSSEYIWRGDR